ncbi:MAG TPA: hypothetical protein VG345_08240 [Bryobacteraceae bacterium]|jgi:hypothetical protein|nr:hypothetical protein [Bryobacteraceae bacterium]
MKNAISRFGYTCAAAAILAGLAGAQTLNRITVNLPQDVLAGGTTLPAGSYTITDIEPFSGNHVFVFRGENGKPVAIQAETIDQSSEQSKTAVVLSKTGSEVRLDKLLIEGSSLGYEFAGGHQNGAENQK